MSIESVMPSNHLILCHPLLLLLSVFPSIRIFSHESALHIMWPKDWSFSISPSNEYSGLISFTIDWFDLLAIQGSLKSLLQHQSSASIFWCSGSLMVRLSHLYMTSRKPIALTLQTTEEVTTEKIDMERNTRKGETGLQYSMRWLWRSCPELNFTTWTWGTFSRITAMSGPRK